MGAFTHRMPEPLHDAAKAWLAKRPWITQAGLVNEALARYIEMPGEYSYLRRNPSNLDDIVELGTLSDVDAKRVRATLLGGGKIAILGPTRSGRTTLARALLGEYQRVPGFPRRAALVVSNAEEYEPETPLLKSVIHSRGREDAIDRAIESLGSTFDIVFIDVTGNPLSERVVQFLRVARKDGIGAVVVGHEKDSLNADAGANFDLIIRLGPWTDAGNRCTIVRQ